MFSDRLWILKVAAALSTFSLLAAASDRALGALHPKVEQVAVFTEDLRGKTIVVLGKKVVSADAGGFEFNSRLGPIRVLTPTPPPVGAYFSAVTQPTATRTLTASVIQINAGWTWKRPLNYILSILVVCVYVWSIRDCFRWRIADGVFRGRY